MLNRERLFAVLGRDFSEKEALMDDSKLLAYEDELNSFIESLPKCEKKIKEAYIAKDMNAMQANFQTLWNSLNKIHADNLAFECHRHMSGLRALSYQQIEEDIDRFMSTVNTFSIDLQMASREENLAPKVEPQAAPPRRPVVPLEMPVEKNSILAVDDAAFFLNILKFYLSGTEYKLTCVNSGATALKFLSSNRPALFILDIDMPGMNGYELALNIKEKGHTAPIIFLTANSAKSYVLRAIQAGASDFLVKPIDKEQVLQRIAKHILK